MEMSRDGFFSAAEFLNTQVATVTYINPVESCCSLALLLLLGSTQRETGQNA